MELRDYIRILQKSWTWIIAATLLGVAGAAAYSLLATPQYESRTQLYVSVRGDSSATGELVQGSTFARQIVGSYVDVIKTGIVLDPVIEELGLDMTSNELAETLTPASPLNSVLINITASNTDPQLAADIANAVGASFTTAVQTQLEPDSNGVKSPVNLTTTQVATKAIDPVSPNTKMNLALGLLLGLALGVGVAILRSVLDTRVHSVSDIEHLTEKPLLGGIAFDADTAKRPLIVHDDPKNPRAEAFRTLRTNLQFLDAVHEGNKVFVVTSAQPTEGKSTTVANLAIALAETGASVALLEGDLRRPKVSSYMGLETGAGMTDVLIGKAELGDVLQRWGRSKLHVLPAGRIPPNPSELLGSEAMDRLLSQLQQDFEYVLIDAPPILLVTDAAVIGAKASGTLMVIAAGQTKKQAVTAALRSLETANTQVLGVIATMLPTKGPDSYSYGNYGYGYTYTESTDKNKKSVKGLPGKRSQNA